MLPPILYVEDEEDYQMLVQRILTKAGLNVHIATTGSEFIDALRHLEPSLVILDINLPDTDGYSLCRKLRQDPAWDRMPILMLTVRRRPEEWLQGFSCGADDYVQKPLDPTGLVERVRSCLNPRSRSSKDSGNGEYSLIQAALAGNRPAFEILIQQHKGRLLDSMRASGRSQADSEDLVASAYARAYERLGQFRGRSSFYTWLYRIAINEANHGHRRENMDLSLDEITGSNESNLPRSLAEADPVGQRLNVHLRETQLRHAVACVPKPYQQMLRWHFIRGLSYQSMAKRLKVPPGTVMSRLFRAKQLLRDSWNSNAG